MYEDESDIVIVNMLMDRAIALEWAIGQGLIVKGDGSPLDLGGWSELMKVAANRLLEYSVMMGES